MVLRSAASLSCRPIMKNTIVTTRYATPCGELELGSFGPHLCLCDWTGPERHHASVAARVCRMLRAPMEPGMSHTLELAIRRLDEYFEGGRDCFDVPLLPVGTPFQQAVWDALLSVPRGATESYGSLARRIGRPAAVRAVAAANGANAISLFISCHRIIGSDGSLTGYGGGLPAKRFLLALEAR